MINIEEIKDLNAKGLLDKIYGKELNTKKTVLEYIELTKILKTEGVPRELIEETYALINDSIEAMKVNVKPNTIMHLKNQLRSQLGKLVKVKENKKEENEFIKYFKSAYPEGKRSRSFTYVMQDINQISAEQIWTTLTYMNRLFIKERKYFVPAEKKETIKMIQKMLDKGDIKYVNQMKSMDKFLRMLNVKIVEQKGKYKVK